MFRCPCEPYRNPKHQKFRSQAASRHRLTTQLYGYARDNPPQDQAAA